MAIYSSGNISFLTVDSYNSNSIFSIYSKLDPHSGSSDLLSPSLFTVDSYNSNSIFTIYSNLDPHSGSSDLLYPAFFTVDSFNSNSLFTLSSNKNKDTFNIFISTNDSRPKSSFGWR